MPEYRAYITIPGLPIDGVDDASLELHRYLDRAHADLGPVLGGTDAGVQVILSTDATTALNAASRMHDAVVDGLRAIARGDLYPSNVELELVDEPGAP